MPDLPLVDRKTLAHILAVRPRTIDRLVGEGALAPEVRGRAGRPSRYRVEACVPAYLAHVTRAPAPGDAQAARAARDQAQAELTRLRLEERRRELLPRSQVIREGQQFIAATMAKMRALPGRLVRAGLLAPSAEPAAAELLREAQEEISRWRTDLDLLAAAGAGRST